jgi:hypothetical protein
MISYLRRLLTIWATWVFAVADLIAFVVDASVPEIVFPPYLYWAIAGVGFIFANFRIFSDQVTENAKLRRLLEARDLEEAEIHLAVESSSFKHRAPLLISTGRTENGLKPGGLPIEAYIYARVEMENRGFEEGSLIWAVDLEASDLPEVFVLNEKSKDGEFEGFSGHLAARSRSTAWWRLDIAVDERDPEEFAAILRDSTHYILTLTYQTKRIGGASGRQALTIEGSFEDYRKTLHELWRAAGYTHLALSD